MKRGKAWLIALMVVIPIILSLNLAYAQNMNIWTGIWFKMTVKSSGYNIDYPGISKENDSSTFYLKIWNVDEVNKMVYCDMYSYEDGTWNAQSLNFNFLGHHSWEFIAWIYEKSDYVENDVDRTEFTAFTLLIQGTIKEGSLISAKLMSLGGTHWKAVWNLPGYEHYKAEEFTITGSLIKTSKVPVPADKILH